MDIVITYSDISAIVERSLSIIGKRSVDDAGNLLFKDITIGTREKDILKDYYKSAIMHIAAETRQYIRLETDATTSFTIRLTLDDDANPQLETSIKQAITEYIVAYALYSWFTVSAPRLYQKYLTDSQNALSYLTYQIYNRKRPDTLPDPLAPKVDPADN